uniref:Potassium/proton antiporter CemA n=1 Tax=Chaetophoropsis polyrhiza TaxID=2079440 RepID=A0A6H1U5P4_9CHLO|nr:chloroplast envelope membrane protein [Chaetophoropsis polyrhiza]QIZ74202.1 chloroplast envelope membrane protein [Chaetophoropsis polyrhiza]
MRGDLHVRFGNRILVFNKIGKLTILLINFLLADLRVSFYLGTAEPLVKQFRFSKYLLLTSVKSLFVVLFIPFFINIFTKIYIFRPLVEYFWDTKQTEIFLNYELQEKAFTEIRNFEEKIYFDYLLKTSEGKPDVLVFPNPSDLGKQDSLFQSVVTFSQIVPEQKSCGSQLFDFDLGNRCDLKVKNRPWLQNPSDFVTEGFPNRFFEPDVVKFSFEPPNDLFLSKSRLCSFSLSIFPGFIDSDSNIDYLRQKFVLDTDYFSNQLALRMVGNLDLSIPGGTFYFSKNTESIFRKKTRQLAEHYNKESISALTNLLADFMGLIILLILLVNMKMSLMNTTAFLSESFFSLKDSKKAFLMLLFTDLLVGFHSPRGWEVIFHFLFEHFGLPENHNIIFLLVGTFPVLLDALFKYWIFRHLNRHSPATVATFQAMVE